MNQIRLYIITVDEPLYTSNLVKRIIKKYYGHLKGITILPNKMPNKNFFTFILYLHTLYGTKEFIILLIKLLKARLREFLHLDESIKSLIKKYNLKVICTSSINNEKYVEKLRKLNLDMILSFCGQIYRRDILRVPKIGVINKHCALLPKYRGVYPAFWVLLNEEKETGVTIHFIDENIDTGRIVAQKKIKVSPLDTFDSLYRKCHAPVFGMYCNIIEYARKNKYVKSFENNLKDARYYSFPTKGDVKMFRKKKKNFF